MPSPGRSGVAHRDDGIAPALADSQCELAICERWLNHDQRIALCLFNLIHGNVDRFIVQDQFICPEACKTQALQSRQDPFANNFVPFLIESRPLTPEDQDSNMLC